MSAVGEVWEFCAGEVALRCRIEEVRENGTLKMRDVQTGKLIPNQWIELADLVRDLRWEQVGESGGSRS